MKKHLLLIPLLFCLSETISTNSSATSESFLSDKKIEQIDEKISANVDKELKATQSFQYPSLRLITAFTIGTLATFCTTGAIINSIKNDKIIGTTYLSLQIATIIGSLKLYRNAKQNNDRRKKEIELARREIAILENVKSNYYIAKSIKSI